jgi:hypothetical protein
MINIQTCTSCLNGCQKKILNKIGKKTIIFFMACKCNMQFHDLENSSNNNNNNKFKKL